MRSDDKVRQYTPYAFICDDETFQLPIEKQELESPDRAPASPDHEPRFWRRQFGKTVTKRQRFYDWAFGVVMPVICFAFDPIVFKNGGDLLGRYTVFAYMLSIGSIMTTMAWLIWGDRLKAFAAPAAGVMAGGGLAALLIGVLLFPFSLMGLVIMIGALGFTPFFTAIIWARNSVRAYRSAKDHVQGSVLAHTFGLTALLSLVIPWVANSEIGRETLSELARLVR